MGEPSERAWLQAELQVAAGRAKWRPGKHTDERTCTATTRAGRRCKAPRAKRQDGTLAPVCRMHGDHGAMSLEAQRRSLEQLIRFRSAQLRGAETKLAQVLEAIERERVIGLGGMNGHSVEAASDTYVQVPGITED